MCLLKPVDGENLIILSRHVLAVSYGRILSSYPAAVVSAVATLSVACLIVVFTLHSLPDFSDPQLVSDGDGNNHVDSPTEFCPLFPAPSRAKSVGIPGTFSRAESLLARSRR